VPADAQGTLAVADGLAAVEAEAPSIDLDCFGRPDRTIAGGPTQVQWINLADEDLFVPIDASHPAEDSSPTRAFGRFELKRLLGRSSATMAWLAYDPRTTREVVLNMPRVQPPDAASLDNWFHVARMAARLSHPHLAPVAEIDAHDQWPYVAVERSAGQTLPEWLLAHPAPAPAEVAALVCQALEGLAYAHEAGAAHQDLQLHHLLVDEQRRLRIAALDIVVEATAADFTFGGTAEREGHLATALDPGHLRVRRDAAQRDVMSTGLLLHHLLTGVPPLDEADTGRVIARMPPHGREGVRLPWATPFPIAEALRAIVNRATSRQPRQRYLSARTLLRALEGWRHADANDGGGPLALLLDRLHSVGHLPALPGVGALATQLSAVEGRRAQEMVEPILRDVALSFELLRQVNSAQVRGTQVAGNGPVLTVRRCLALVGVNGVREAAASLRAWPGPLAEHDAASLKQSMERVRLAGVLAQALRPPGYDAETIYVIALLQNLGRLMVRYHFPQEAMQIAALMETARPFDADEGEDVRELPGMTEEGASFAVLGVDIESIGAAVARHWGFAEEVVHMIRRLPPNRPVRNADSDFDLLRMAASAANEAVDAITLSPPEGVGAALAKVVQRYARGLGFTPRDMTQALQDARAAVRGDAPVPTARETSSEGTAPAKAARAGSTRAPAEALRAVAGATGR